MALSSDEAYGLIGQIEEVRHEMALAQAALIAFARGKLGQPGQPTQLMFCVSLQLQRLHLRLLSA